MSRTGAGERPMVAVVDDDREVLDYLTALLDRAGYDVAQASSGLRLVATLQVDRPALILLDVNMSWIDGYELCRALKRNPAWRTIPVVFVSGRTAPEDVEEGRSAGGVGFFAKPIDGRALVARVRELIQPHA
ncbi:MAG TPA: response regulator [Kofleriaceae bacterium]|nr:response regulator [Kofleriaceae bacterium]